MSLKNMKEALKKGKLLFGIRQVLKAGHKKSGKKSLKIFAAKDARDETIKKLEDARIKFEISKTKADISKELNLNFESEVFLIK